MGYFHFTLLTYRFFFSTLYLIWDYEPDLTELNWGFMGLTWHWVAVLFYSHSTYISTLITSFLIRTSDYGPISLPPLPTHASNINPNTPIRYIAFFFPLEPFGTIATNTYTDKSSFHPRTNKNCDDERQYNITSLLHNSASSLVHIRRK